MGYGTSHCKASIGGQEAEDGTTVITCEPLVGNVSVPIT